MKIYPIEESDIPELRVLAGECFVDAFYYSERPYRQSRSHPQFGGRCYFCHFAGNEFYHQTAKKK